MATLSLSGCATVGSDAWPPCPPMVEYSPAEQTRAADEVEVLPANAVVVAMLSNYSVMREQARACR
ncbi:hypothetical protein E4L95_16790 [Paracoccus liaowanqingii]|uniref:Uncharacterized protein n=1 Tax=Paracoccus liaowanqingii TaxID=2560053 RepID=A0A4Z1CA71_9RHOB|nr:hypothetical protein E4L95_16790 [Paracoccus liaowanqingii]